MRTNTYSSILLYVCGRVTFVCVLTHVSTDVFACVLTHVSTHVLVCVLTHVTTDVPMRVDTCNHRRTHDSNTDGAQRAE